MSHFLSRLVYLGYIGPVLLTACASTNRLLALKLYCQVLQKTRSDKLALKRHKQFVFVFRMLGTHYLNISFYFLFFIFKVTCGQVWWPILGICALHLTHPSAHTPGSSWGFGALLQGLTSVVVLKVERTLVIHSPHRQFLSDLRLEPTTSGYKSDALSIRPRLPLYDCPYFFFRNWFAKPCYF